MVFQSLKIFASLGDLSFLENRTDLRPCPQMTEAGAGLAAQASDLARPSRLLFVGRLWGLTVRIVLWMKYFLAAGFLLGEHDPLLLDKN